MNLRRMRKDSKDLRAFFKSNIMRHYYLMLGTRNECKTITRTDLLSLDPALRDRDLLQYFPRSFPV
jgi:hypothetical protein